MSLDLPDHITGEQITAACQALGLGQYADGNSPDGYYLVSLHIEPDGLHARLKRRSSVQGIGPSEVDVSIPNADRARMP